MEYCTEIIREFGLLVDDAVQRERDEKLEGDEILKILMYVHISLDEATSEQRDLLVQQLTDWLNASFVAVKEDVSEEAHVESRRLEGETRRDPIEKYLEVPENRRFLAWNDKHIRKYPLVNRDFTASAYSEIFSRVCQVLEQYQK